MNLVWRDKQELDFGFWLGTMGASVGFLKQGNGTVRFGFWSEWARLSTGA